MTQAMVVLYHGEDIDVITAIAVVPDRTRALSAISRHVDTWASPPTRPITLVTEQDEANEDCTIVHVEEADGYISDDDVYSILPVEVNLDVG